MLDFSVDIHIVNKVTHRPNSDRGHRHPPERKPKPTDNRPWVEVITPLMGGASVGKKQPTTDRG
eukprot:scaffold292307_cov35-Tisochrysis_lutea.AAC.1